MPVRRDPDEPNTLASPAGQLATALMHGRTEDAEAFG